MKSLPQRDASDVVSKALGTVGLSSCANGNFRKRGQCPLSPEAPPFPGHASIIEQGLPNPTGNRRVSSNSRCLWIKFPAFTSRSASTTYFSLNWRSLHQAFLRLQTALSPSHTASVSSLLSSLTFTNISVTAKVTSLPGSKG